MHASGTSCSEPHADLVDLGDMVRKQLLHAAFLVGLALQGIEALEE
jgi:hypothetical protein